MDTLQFINSLNAEGIDFYTGVPDSLLKAMCACLQDKSRANSASNIIAANEGNAVAIAAGYHLATGRIPVVYMQNSGLGNAVNPLLSLTDKKVYHIPLLLIIGWRGQPGLKDEPQHVTQGELTVPLLEQLRVQYQILNQASDISRNIKKALDYMHESHGVYAFVIEKDTFSNSEQHSFDSFPNLEISREKAIRIVSECISDAIVVSTTGMISRELFEIREQSGIAHKCDFLTVGSMGHASQIALGIALQKKDRKVCCFDGDGAALMHMGGMALIAQQKPVNYIHIVFNNGAHDSVGGQPTAGFQVDFPAIAKACGYSYAVSVSTVVELKTKLKELLQVPGPVFLEVKVQKGNRKDLGRPTSTPVENKKLFMDFLAE